MNFKVVVESEALLGGVGLLVAALPLSRLAPGCRGQFHPIGEYELDIRCEIGRLVKFHDFADRLGKDAGRFAR